MLRIDEIPTTYSILAMSMLPDGAEAQLDDWTIFFLNQTPFNTISPVLGLDTPETQPIDLPDEDGEGGKKRDLLCVLNLVRTKHDKALDRCAELELHWNTGSYDHAEGPKSWPWPSALDILISRYSKYVVLQTSSA